MIRPRRVLDYPEGSTAPPPHAYSAARRRPAASSSGSTSLASRARSLLLPTPMHALVVLCAVCAVVYVVVGYLPPLRGSPGGAHAEDAAPGGAGAHQQQQQRSLLAARARGEPDASDDAAADRVVDVDVDVNANEGDDRGSDGERTLRIPADQDEDEGGGGGGGGGDGDAGDPHPTDGALDPAASEDDLDEPGAAEDDDDAVQLDSSPRAQPRPATEAGREPPATTAAPPTEEFDEKSDSDEFEEPEAPVPTDVRDGVVGDAATLGGTYDGSDVRLLPQVELPRTGKPIIQHLDKIQNYWPLHAILRERGWQYAPGAPASKVTLFISRGRLPSTHLKPGKQMLNSMGYSGCIGGSKTLQLSCRRQLAKDSGCAYDSLEIQPPQYNMLQTEECQRFFAVADRPELAEKLYLSKPAYTYHGAGIRLMRLKELRAEYGACRKPRHAIVMDYIAKPATMRGGYKYDFRSYLLVASLKPQLVFLHDGFVRKSDKVYDADARDLNVHITNKVTQSKAEHFFNFSYLAHSLHADMGLPRDYLDRHVRPRMQAVSRFMFETARAAKHPPNHNPGRWHLFGVDWMLDAAGKLHLLEGNGFPLVTHYPSALGLTPRVWEEMVDLLLKVHADPASLGTKVTVRDRFRFGQWTLVFNELEEMWGAAHGSAYDACLEFGAASARL